MKKYLRKIVPPILYDMFDTYRNGKYGFFGNYESWEAAKKQCIGYDSEVIYEKVKQAVLQVRNGKAVYERDSVIFDHIEYSWPMLAGLMYIAAVNKGSLSVLNFGGSLGSSYFQNRKYFDGLKVEWSVIEQPYFVQYGKTHISEHGLDFFYSIEDCIKQRKPDVLLLSSVLQYLKNPYETLENLCSIGAEYIIIDRTSFIDSKEDVISIQKVPPTIYDASYPAWFFAEEKFLNYFANRYELLEKFDGNDRGSWLKGLETFYQGYIFRKMRVSI